MVRGLQGLAYGSGLQSRVLDTLKNQRQQQANLLGRSRLGGKLGKIGGGLFKKFGQKGLSALMKKGLGLAFQGATATNPWLKGLTLLAPIVAGAAMKGLGTRAGSSLAGVFDKSARSKIKPTSDLRSSGWENLEEFRKGIGESESGAAWGAASGDLVSGLKGEVGSQLGDLALGSEFGQKLAKKYEDFSAPGERESFKQSFGGGSPILNMKGGEPGLGKSVTAGGYNPLEQMQDMTSYESLSGEQDLAMTDALRGGAYSGFGMSNTGAGEGFNPQDWGSQLVAQGQNFPNPYQMDDLRAYADERNLQADNFQTGGAARIASQGLRLGKDLGIGQDFESSLQDVKMRNAMPEKGILSKLFGRKQDPRESFSSSLEEFPSVLGKVTDEVRKDRLESAKGRYEDKESFDSSIGNILQSIQGMKEDSTKRYTPEFLENKFAQQAELEPMMNPFTGEELGEAPVNPKTGRLSTGVYRIMNNINRLGNPYSDIVSALERKESKEPERGILDKLLGRETNYIDELEKRILDNPESDKIRMNMVNDPSPVNQLLNPVAC